MRSQRLVQPRSSTRDNQSVRPGDLEAAWIQCYVNYGRYLYGPKAEIETPYRRWAVRETRYPTPVMRSITLMAKLLLTVAAVSVAIGACSYEAHESSVDVSLDEDTDAVNERVSEVLQTATESVRDCEFLEARVHPVEPSAALVRCRFDGTFWTTDKELTVRCREAHWFVQTNLGFAETDVSCDAEGRIS